MKISHGYNANEFGANSSGCVVLAYRRHGSQAFFFIIIIKVDNRVSLCVS